MTSKTSKIIAWVAGAPALFLYTFAAVMKFTPPPAAGTPAADMMAKMGMTPEMNMVLGVVQILLLILFLVPRTALVGYVMIIGYMSGALATNLTHGFSQAEIAPLYVCLALLAVHGYFRFPELSARLLKKM